MEKEAVLNQLKKELKIVPSFGGKEYEAMHSSTIKEIQNYQDRKISIRYKKV